MSRAKEMRELTSGIDVDANGNVGIGTTSPSDYYAKDLVVGAADEGGITIVNGTTEQGYLMFADGTGGSPDARFRGYIGYDHNIDHMQMTSGGILKFLVNNTTQAITVDTSGRLTVGTIGTDTTLSGGQPAFQVTGSGFNGYMAAVRRDSSVYSSGLLLAKSRNSTADNFTVLQDNDKIGSIIFIGDDGTDLDTYGAMIQAEVNGTPSQNNMPTDLIFSTNSGTSATTERMRILKDGNVGIGTTDPKSTLDTGYTRIYNSGAASSPSAGKGLELHYVTSGRTQGEGAYLISYDRDNSAYKQFVVDANNIELSTGGNTRLSILSSGNVGIGDTNPGYKLTVDNDTGDGGIFRLNNEEIGLNVSVNGGVGDYTNSERMVVFNATRFDSGTSPKLRLGGQGGVEIAADANNVRMVVGSNGYVGIGTTDPGAILSLNGGSTTAQTFQSSWSSGTGRIAFIGGSSGVDGSSANSTAAKIESLATAPGGAATGDLKLIVNSGDSFVTGIEIVPDGAVRLALQGTHTTIGSYDDPRAPYGWNNITTNNHADVLWGLNTRLIGSGTGHDFEVVSSHGSINHSGIMFTGNGNPEGPNKILFYTRSGSSTAGTVYNSSSQKFTMNSGGSFLAEEGNSGAVIRLDNIGNSGTSNHYIELSSNLPGYANGRYNCLKTSFNDLHFAANNTYTGYINYNGGFTDVSDQSLKENVVTIDGALSKVEQLQGRYFTWISEDQSDDRQIGFIAQEVEDIIPELVTTSDTGIKGMSYGKTTALLVEAIKEQQATIQALQDRLDAAGL